MKPRFATFISMFLMTTPGLGLLGGMLAGLPINAAAQENHEHSAPAKLVQMVREATRQFIDVNNAGQDYQPLFGCVSGPDHGAMGIHYINVKLLDSEIIASQLEALIYEPVGDRRRLVGVEYIVDAAAWVAAHPGMPPPALEGQAFQFVDAPNRYGIAAFFELHVWAWRDNPNGAFVDWNNKVSCEGQ
jgi:hypothetical protein